MCDSKFIVEIKTSNAAFEDDCNFEIARILKKLAQDLEIGMGDSTILRDINGNRVGFAEFDED